MNNVIKATKQSMVNRAGELLRELRRGCGSERTESKCRTLRRFVFAKYQQENEAGENNGWFELMLEEEEYQMADDH